MRVTLGDSGLCCTCVTYFERLLTPLCVDSDVTECIVCVPAHDSLTFSFLSFLFFDWVGVLWPQLSKVSKPVRWASSVPFPPAVAGRQIVIVRAAAYASDSGESLHCFLVGANKSYVTATSDL